MSKHRSIEHADFPSYPCLLISAEYKFVVRLPRIPISGETLWITDPECGHTTTFLVFRVDAVVLLDSFSWDGEIARVYATRVASLPTFDKSPR